MGEVEPVERPVGDGGERLRAVAVAREVRRDTAAEFHAAAGIKAVEDDLTDECAVEPDGEVHGAGAGVVLPRDGEEVVLVGRAVVVLAEVVAPPAVAVVVKTEGGVGGFVRIGERVERQAGGGKRGGSR